MTDRDTLVRTVREFYGGDVREAAKGMGVSVSYILAAAPELKTPEPRFLDNDEQKIMHRALKRSVKFVK